MNKTSDKSIISEEKKKYILLKLSEEKKVFKCAIGNKKIKDCIDEELERIQYNDLGEDTSKNINRIIFSCLESMLLGCVGKKNIDIDFVTSEIEITMVKTKNTSFEIKEVGLSLTLKKDDEIILNVLKKCLNFFNVSCISKTNVKIIFSFSKDPNKSLKEYKKDLLVLKDELEKIVGWREIET